MRNYILGLLTMVLVASIAFVVHQSITALPKIPKLIQEQNKPYISDNEQIKQALIAKNSWQESDDTIVEISSNDGMYAGGTITGSGGGGYFFAAKTSGIWEIVADGNGTIMCSSLLDYPEFPSTLIPECYDPTTNEIVNR